MKESIKKIEYDKITQQLSDFAVSDAAKERCSNLSMELDQKKAVRNMHETTEARTILDLLGLPPLAGMQGTAALFSCVVEDALLSPSQLSQIAVFLTGCRRMQQYLKRSEYLELHLSSYWRGFIPCEELAGEITTSIRGDEVESSASTELRKLRNDIEAVKDKIRAKLEQCLRSKKDWFTDQFVVQRGGHYVLPVKKEYKSQLGGTVYDQSGSGNTLYMEPAAVGKLHSELTEHEIAEENEVRRILYVLTAQVEEHLTELKSNMELMSELDFAFAKAKLSQHMKAAGVPLTADRHILIRTGRHPLLPPETCIPLDFEIGEEEERNINWKQVREGQGIVITGPNTGGKTVALKTVGLLSMMAQSGLHVPVAEGSSFCMHSRILCDMGDGQSIEQNLSTFSSHLVRILAILDQMNEESLVLLDELGSGTDPAEGMGIAIAILKELAARNCLYVATTHYPEVKDYANRTKGLINARMAFDRESMQPLFRLEIGEAGESCALYIAKHLGLPEHMLINAAAAAYGTAGDKGDTNTGAAQKNQNMTGDRAKQYEQVLGLLKLDDTQQEQPEKTKRPGNTLPVPHIKKEAAPKQVSDKAQRFHIGDSVMVYPKKEIGIVFREADEQGEIGVQIKKSKHFVNHKRLQLKASASTLYPDDYDFSIVFDSVETRKARHKMDRKHEEGLVIAIEKNGYEGQKES